MFRARGGGNRTFNCRCDLFSTRAPIWIITPKDQLHILSMARDLAPDWILQETLAIQAQTAQWFKDKQAEHAGQKPLTLTVLGCGMRQYR